jgi:hypothetical protein
MKISRVVEVAVAELYAAKFKRPFIVVVGYLKEYDIASYSGDYFVEVKLDTMSVTSGNVAVEYTCKGQPSGIAASSADYFVFVVPEGKSLVGYEVDVRNLKNALKGCRLVRGGDDYASTMKLLPLERLKDIACDKFPVQLNLNELKEYWKR